MSHELLKLLKYTLKLISLATTSLCLLGGVGSLVLKLESLSLAKHRRDELDESELSRAERKSTLGQLVRAFSGCRLLRELNLSLYTPKLTEEEFRTACMPPRLRNATCEFVAYEDPHTSVTRYVLEWFYSHARVYQ